MHFKHLTIHLSTVAPSSSSKRKKKKADPGWQGSRAGCGGRCRRPRSELVVRARRPGREHAATAPTWRGGRGRRVPDAGVPTWSLCGGGAVGGGCCWVISSPSPGCKVPSMPGASTVTQLGSGPGGAEPLCRPSVRGEEPQVPHSSRCDQGDVSRVLGADRPFSGGPACVVLSVNCCGSPTAWGP